MGKTPEQALSLLLEGNKRYAEGKPLHPRQDPQRRAELSDGQQPIAAVLTCADSRVVPEFIFDQGVGDLFVVRVAGNIACESVIGSLQYAVENLKVPLVIVLGHSKCGAVSAAVNRAEARDELEALICRIKPAVESAKGSQGCVLENSIRENVKIMLNLLKSRRAFSGAGGKSPRIIGALYDIDSGAVTVLD